MIMMMSIIPIMKVMYQYTDTALQHDHNEDYHDLEDHDDHEDSDDHGDDYLANYESGTDNALKDYDDLVVFPY